MSNQCKQTEWILETIDHLRRRKARPDLQRICHVVKRRFGLSATDTEAKLEKLVDAEVVIKVDYKGNTSYRNAAKWKKSMLGCAVLNSRPVSIKVIQALLELSQIDDAASNNNNNNNNEDERDENTVGSNEDIKDTEKNDVTRTVEFSRIESWMKAHCEGIEHLKSPLPTILKREIDAGRICQHSNGRFSISPAQRKQIAGGVIKPLDATKKSDVKPFTAGNNTTGSRDRDEGRGKTNHVATSSADSNSMLQQQPLLPKDSVVIQKEPKRELICTQPAKRGRPPKNRPPAGTVPNNAAPIAKPAKQKRAAEKAADREKTPFNKAAKRVHYDTDVCDLCHKTPQSNAEGQQESLLYCKDCTARAHPSCLGYTPFLASRAYKGPWQCVDCKSCFVCNDSGRPDQMLFCDGCDKGYHMTCHQPSVMKKPSGTWECYECRLENSTVQCHEFLAKHGNRRKSLTWNDESTPPTPAESPVPMSFPDASSWSVDDVVKHLTTAGFAKEAHIFKEQEIDGVALLLLKRADVLRGLELKLGPALKLNRHVQGLQMARHNLTSC